MLFLRGVTAVADIYWGCFLYIVYSSFFRLENQTRFTWTKMSVDTIYRLLPTIFIDFPRFCRLDSKVTNIKSPLFWLAVKPWETIKRSLKTTLNRMKHFLTRNWNVQFSLNTLQVRFTVKKYYFNISAFRHCFMLSMLAMRLLTAI